MSAVKNFAFKIFHLFAALHFLYAIYYDWVYVLPEEIILREYSFGGKLVYLTVLDVFLQAFYFSVAFVNDCVGSNETDIKDRPLIRKIKDYFFSAFAFPLALDVALLFWSMYTIDRRSVFPDEVDWFFPAWLNHILHTNVAVFIVIELVILHRQYPSRKEGICGLMIFMFSYLAWMHVTRLFAGKWAYPILEMLDIPGKIAFFVFTMSFPIAMYFFGEFLNGIVWSAGRIGKANEVKRGIV